MVKEVTGIEFAPGGHSEAVFTQHTCETVLAAEDGGIRGGAKILAVAVGKDPSEAGDGDFGTIGDSLMDQGVDQAWFDRIIRIYESNKIASSMSEADVASDGKTLVGLMNNLEAPVGTG